MSIETNPHTPLTVEAVNSLIDEHFPGIHAGGRRIDIVSVADRVARCRMRPSERAIRPGGTLSGPAMFTLADYTIYVALIATLGPPAIPPVTSNLNINFLKRPEPVDLLADARIIRLGRRLAYCDVQLYCEGRTELVAHATGSYSILTG